MCAKFAKTYRLVMEIALPRGARVVTMLHSRRVENTLQQGSKQLFGFKGARIYYSNFHKLFGIKLFKQFEIILEYSSTLAIQCHNEETPTQKL